MALKGIVVMKSKRNPRPNGKLRLRIFVPVERVLGFYDFLIIIKDLLFVFYKIFSLDFIICVKIIFLITPLRKKKVLSGFNFFLVPPNRKSTRLKSIQMS